MTRKADFAVLITTANSKRGWNGFGIIKEVLVVSPLAVISLTSLLRLHLIEMLKAKIPTTKRAKIAQQLLKYIRSPDFKNPIEEVVRTTTELCYDLGEEMKTHARIWNKRFYNYQRIRWNSQLVHENVQLILQGKETKPLNRSKQPQIKQLSPPIPPTLDESGE